MKLKRIALVTLLPAAAAVAGCGDVNAKLAQLSEAQHLAADLQVDFTKGADAANRAVMASSDDDSVKYAQEAEAARRQAHSRIDALRPLLDQLGYVEEARDLHEFEGRFAEYEKLDRQILDLAVENSNLKARRLSFEAGQAAAETFRKELESVAARPGDPWRVRAVVATAVSAVREIQVLQARHIAEPEDAPMTQIEADMKAQEAVARDALAGLPPLVARPSRPRLAQATDALNRFLGINAQIVAMSRRNTNVRSVALSLNEKQRVIPACQESLRALRAALARHGYHQGRWG